LGEIRETGQRGRLNDSRFEKRLKKFLEETEKALHLQPVSERKTDKAEAESSMTL
jgi:hypothetical protein